MKLEGLFGNHKPMWIALGGLLLIGAMSWWMAEQGNTVPGFGNESTLIKEKKSGTGGVNSDTKCAYNAYPDMQLASGVDYRAEIITNHGTIKLDLFEDKTPLAVNNFVVLADDDFYKGITFHRVIKNFVIQAGDPGVCNAGPGYKFDNEIVDDLRFKPYVLAMANAGADTNGSQFFITTHDFNQESLNGGYTIFGEVLDGFDVVDEIAGVRTDSSDRPVKDVVIEDIVIRKF